MYRHLPVASAGKSPWPKCSSTCERGSLIDRWPRFVSLDEFIKVSITARCRLYLNSHSTKASIVFRLREKSKSPPIDRVQLTLEKFRRSAHSPNLIDPRPNRRRSMYMASATRYQSWGRDPSDVFRKGRVVGIARGHISLYTLFVILDSGVNTILIQRTIERQELRSGAVRGVRISMRTRRPMPLNRVWKKSRVSFSLGTPVVFVRGGSRPRSIYFTPSLSEKYGAAC